MTIHLHICRTVFGVPPTTELVTDGTVAVSPRSEFRLPVIVDHLTTIGWPLIRTNMVLFSFVSHAECGEWCCVNNFSMFIGADRRDVFDASRRVPSHKCVAQDGTPKLKLDDCCN
jgi:hypothetical protein